MADELTIKIQALIEEAAANMQRMGQSVANVANEAQASNAKHAHAAAGTHEHASGIKALREEAEKAKEPIHEFGTRLTELISAAGGGATGGKFALLMGAGGITLALAEIAKGTIEWHDEIARLSDVMNGNVQIASIWVGIFNQLGLPTKDLEMGMRSLSLAIDHGSKALHDMGIATVDTHGKLMPLNTVLQEAQKWFHAHEGSSLAAARAVELFGRAGLELLPIMSQSNAAFQAEVQQLTEMGLIMDKTGLQHARQLDFELGNLGMVLRSLQVAVGEPLIHAFAVAGGSIAQAIIPHLEQVKAAIANVVNFIIGVIEALTGWSFHLSDVAQQFGKLSDAEANAGDASDTLADQQRGAADAARGLRDATREQVDAIQDQIRAIQEADRALEQYTNEQIRQLQLEGQQENFDVQQQTAAQRKASKLQEIARLQNEYEIALREGNLDHAAQIYDQLAAAKAEESQMEREDQRQVDDFKRQQQEESLRHTLETTRAEHAIKIQALQDQQKAIQEAAQKAMEAMQRGASGMSDAIVGAAGVIGGQADNMRNKISDAGTQAGHNFGEAIKAAIRGIVQFFQESDAERQRQLDMWGRQAGDAFGRGFAHGLFSWLDQPYPVHFADDTHALPANRDTRRYQEGGIVPGAYSMPRPIIAHGSEAVLTPSDQANLLSFIRGAAPLMGAGGGAQAQSKSVTINNTFHISGGNAEDIGAAVASHMQQMMGVL